MNISGDAINALLEKRGASPQWANEYGEPGYEQPENGIILADWNHVSRRVFAWLEHHGYGLEWGDEWISNENGDKVYRSSPDSYDWSPSFIILDDATVLGKDEALSDIDVYIEHLTGEGSGMPRCDNFGVDWGDHGFEKVNREPYETGFHPGQDDNPAKILKEARQQFLTCEFVFQRDETSQFYITYSLWKREKENQS